jgi:hypothetical protein
MKLLLRKIESDIKFLETLRAARIAFTLRNDEHEFLDTRSRLEIIDNAISNKIYEMVNLGFHKYNYHVKDLEGGKINSKRYIETLCKYYEIEIPGR